MIFQVLEKSAVAKGSKFPLYVLKYNEISNRNKAPSNTTYSSLDLAKNKTLHQ
jgi:hypothetical protein